VRKDDPVGLQEPSIVSYVIYPNPATDLIQVSSTEKIEQLEVLDLNGMRVLSSSIPQINIQSLPIGIYLVRFNMNGVTMTKRISKI
jgi:hypothetical protein